MHGILNPYLESLGNGMQHQASLNEPLIWIWYALMHLKRQAALDPRFDCVLIEVCFILFIWLERPMLNNCQD